ncbi:hypothetical protein C0J52_21153 [Blattella germanica]|nr:hypothetical protein C0J52_21153 [Blattella germanica]
MLQPPSQQPNTTLGKSNRYLLSCCSLRKMAVRVWKKSDDGRFKWMTLTAKYLPETIDLFRKSFYVHEPVCKVVGLAHTKKGGDQFAKLLADVAEDGMSVIAVEVATDKVVGAALNKLQYVCFSQYKEDPEKSVLERHRSPDNDPAVTELIDFENQIEEEVDIFSRLGVNCLIDHMFLATHPDFYGQGIGLNTVVATVEFAKALNKGEDIVVPISEDKFPWKKTPPPLPEAVTAMFTSSVSQKIGYNLGWEEISVISYEKMYYQGQSYISKLEKENWCTKYFALKLP